VVERSLIREIVRLRTAGRTYVEIVEALHVSMTTISDAVKAWGGVFDSDAWTNVDRRLSLEERIEIRVGVEVGQSFTAIAGELGRAVSTVSREVGVNGGRAGYRPLAAHRHAIRRAGRAKPTKLAARPALCARVVADLEALWSPEQIARRLRAEFPEDPEMWVSHETIYKTIYVQGRGELRRELARCLRTGRARRVSRNRIERQGRIPDMVNISDRPAEVEDRAVPGHWEGDLIVGKNNKSAVGTLVERSTRFVMLLHLPDHHGAEEVRDAMTATIQTLPTALARSITWDQGKEMAQHARFSLDTGVDVYFCDPHSPWQRGTNENTNGLLRQYMPKGTDLTVHTAEDLERIARSLNGRPRKTLEWKTPAEALAQLVAVTA
jgi:IS30 family transposase